MAGKAQPPPLLPLAWRHGGTEARTEPVLETKPLTQVFYLS